MLPPSSAPTCKIVVSAPGGLTRILHICCVPEIPPLSPPEHPPGSTASDTLVAGPITFHKVSGGLLGPLVNYYFLHINYTNHAVLDLGTEMEATFATPCSKVVLEVFSEAGNGSGAEFEAVAEFGFTVSRFGPLPASQSPQTVVLQSPDIGPIIKAVRIKSPNAQSYLINLWGLPK